MKDFEHFMPAHLYFGRGKVDNIGELCISTGKKALIVTGRNSARRSGLLDRVINNLAHSGIDSVVFDQVKENPLTTTVDEGASFLGDNHCDFVIGLGGGSAIDSAKGIAFSAVNPGSIAEYIAGRPGRGALPIVAVTTTAGTGTEANRVAVFTNPDTHDKRSIKVPFLYPAISIIDPGLMTTLTPRLAAATGFDALCHSIEAFLSRAATPITDLFALHAIKTILTNLPIVYEDPGNLDAWDQMALCNTLGGMVIDRAGITLAHAMEHAVSGLYDVRHGDGLAAVTIPCLIYLMPVGGKKLSWLGQTMGLKGEGWPEADAAKAAIDSIKNLLYKINLNYTLSGLGVQANDLDWLTDNCMRTNAYAIQNNLRLPTRDELKNLYRSCM